MKIPDSVRIGGIEYKIVHAPNVNNGEVVACGLIDDNKSIIQISTTIEMSDETKCVTLLHEILHGIINHAGAGEKLDIEKEEEIVDICSRGLYQVLQDNCDRLFDLKD